MTSSNGVGTIVRMSVLATCLIGVVAALPAPALAQACYDCEAQIGPPLEVSCVSGSRGQNCSISCGAQGCRCQVFVACKGGEGLASCSPSDPPSQLRAARIAIDASGISISEQIAEPMPIALTRRSQEALDDLPGLLASTLEGAHESGKIEGVVVERGVYIRKNADGSARDIVKYIGDVTIAKAEATIDFHLIDHVEFTRLRAVIRNRGNSGLVELIDHAGLITSRTW